MKKKYLDKNIIKLNFKISNSKKYKLETFRIIALFTKKLKIAYLLAFHYLVH